MSYEVVVPKPVQKQLNKLPEGIREKILEKVLQLADDPRPAGVKKLKGLDNEYRIRINDYRVRYEIDEKKLVVIILHCSHRREVYRE